MADLDDREQLVLQTVIDEYVQNSEPVGSRNVSKVGPLKMSPATIRNIMGDLEEKGYLVQPHTSAGRIPTDLGYRYYIDHLVAVELEEPDMAHQINKTFTFKASNVPALMHEFSRRLGALTNSVGFIVTSQDNTASLQQIEFARLNKGGAVLAILITKAGIVKNLLLNLPASITDSELQHMGNYLTEQLSTMSLGELRTKLNSDYRQSAGEVRKMLSTLINIEEAVFNEEIFDNTFIVEGASNILNFPEFQDTQKFKTLLHTLEEKKTLAEILERCMQNKGVQIFVGSEIGLTNIEELGLVTGSYEKKGNIVGMLGVIGPKRMEYSKMISVVNYSSQILSQMLNELYGGYSEE